MGLKISFKIYKAYSIVIINLTETLGVKMLIF